MNIRKAKQQADLVVVSMHWGIHFTEAEVAAYQFEYAHDAIDAGADLILGHHAHILKPIEVYKGKVIFYSLGNFAMEDPNNMQRDKATLRQDMRTSRKHMEMTKIRAGFGQMGKHLLKAVKTHGAPPVLFLYDSIDCALWEDI